MDKFTMIGLKAARRRMKLTQQQLAEAVGVEQPTIQRWESGVRMAPLTSVRRLAEILNVTVGDLIGDNPAGAAPPAPRPAVSDATREWLAPPSSWPTDLPVLGSALGTDLDVNGANRDGIELVELGLADIIDYVRRPPMFAANLDAYAIYVSGASMEPRYDPGELLYVDPRRPPRIGEDVIVQLRSNGEDEYTADRVVSALVKRMVRRTSTQVELEQFNPPLRFTLDMARVLKIHRVVRLGELLGV